MNRQGQMLENLPAGIPPMTRSQRMTMPHPSSHHGSSPLRLNRIVNGLIFDSRLAVGRLRWILSLGNTWDASGIPQNIELEVENPRIRREMPFCAFQHVMTWALNAVLIDHLSYLKQYFTNYVICVIYMIVTGISLGAPWANFCKIVFGVEVKMSLVFLFLCTHRDSPS